MTKNDFGNQRQVTKSIPFILLMDWQLRKIPYQPFLLVMKITLFRKASEKNAREGDITPATSTPQEEEVPLQANFIDENFRH